MKGRLSLSQGKTDSARYYFTHGLSMAIDRNGEVLGLRGLYDLYVKTGQSDSAAKYSMAYSNINDSIHASFSTQTMQQIQAQYQYGHYRKTAEETERKTARLKSRLYLFAFLLLAMAFAAYIWLMRYRTRTASRIRYLNSQYSNSLIQYSTAKRELALLQSENTKKTETITAKEEEIAELQQHLAEYQSDHLRPDDWDMETELLSSPVVAHLHQLAAAGRQPGDKEWSDLRALVNRNLPGFLPALASFSYSMSAREINLCILVKLRFLSSEIANLFNASNPQNISNMRSRLYKHLFGRKGKSADFDEEIRSLGMS
jgi:hypothetical protein